MSAYDLTPERFLVSLHKSTVGTLECEVYCAGFELGQWRCEQLAGHLIEWLPDYALAEEELRFNHANAYQKLRQAAVRVYTSQKYEKRGEVGEIALHAICRDFFSTIPISPRVFYKSASNDVVKSFDMVHARFPTPKEVELWLGESKLYSDGTAAMSAAIKSIGEHLDHGFLTSQKLLLGPQIPKQTPHYEKIIELFKSQVSLDKLLTSAVFAVGILCDSASVNAAHQDPAKYPGSVEKELQHLAKQLLGSKLTTKIRLALIYLPLTSKQAVVDAFDKKLKGLQ